MKHKEYKGIGDEQSLHFGEQLQVRSITNLLNTDMIY